MRLLVGFKKGEEARWLSHLDFQRALQRLLRRAGFPLLYSSGFNPHPLISYASALPVGATGDCEAVELQTEEISEERAFELLSNTDAPGLTCVRVRAVGADFPSLTPLVQAAAWEITLVPDAPLSESRVRELLSGPLIVQKKGKAGIKPLDVIPLIHSVSVAAAPGNAGSIVQNGTENAAQSVILSLIGAHTPTGSLPAALLANALLENSGYFMLHRRALLARRNGGWVDVLDA